MAPNGLREVRGTHSVRGFTLIELLVVMAIISVLSTVVLSSLNVARMKANDAKRLSDIRQIALAVELYADQNNGRYPIGSGNYGSSMMVYESRVDWQWVPFAATLKPYISALGVDPTNNRGEGLMCGNCGGYLYASDGKKFLISAYLAQPSPARAGVNQYGPYAQVVGGCIPNNFWSCD